MLKLPEHQAKTDSNYPLPEPGDYTLTILSVSCDDGHKVLVKYKIQDAGPAANRRLFQTYDLNTEPGCRLFKQCCEAAGAQLIDNNVDLEIIEGEEIVGTIKHKGAYANVVRHRPVDDRTAEK